MFRFKINLKFSDFRNEKNFFVSSLHIYTVFIRNKMETPFENLFYQIVYIWSLVKLTFASHPYLITLSQTTKLALIAAF